MSHGLRPTADAKGRLRASITITMGIVPLARARHMAHEQKIPLSRVFENLLGEVDYRAMFTLFAQRMALGAIVIQTGQPPALVRALYSEYRANLYDEEPSPRLTPAPAIATRSLPQSPVVPLLSSASGRRRGRP